MIICIKNDLFRNVPQYLHEKMMFADIETNLMDSSVVTPIELILGTGLIVMIAKYRNNVKKRYVCSYNGRC